MSELPLHNGMAISLADDFWHKPDSLNLFQLDHPKVAVSDDLGGEESPSDEDLEKELAEAEEKLKEEMARKRKAAEEAR